nr:MFS transporter [Anaerolineae bacterium]
MQNTTSQTSQTPSVWNRDFTILWLGLLQSNFGDAFLAVGALWLVYQVTGSAFAASTILILEGLPKLLGLVAGAVIDRSDKKRLLIVADLFRGVLLILTYAIYWFGKFELWQIYAVVGLLNAASVFYTPTMRSILPTIVPNEVLPRANALMQTGQQAAKVIGAGVAGWVLTYTQSNFALFVDG